MIPLVQKLDMNLYNIKNSFNDMVKKNWDRVYWFVDFHGTIAVADYGDPNLKRTFFAHAKEVLEFASKQPEICLVLWTCSHRDDINDMIEFLKENNIHMEYINENPECPSTKHVNVTQKPYYNVLLDDRAGFEPEDWLEIRRLLQEHYSTKL